MGCSAPTEDDEDCATFPIRIVVDDYQAIQLLYLQYLLMQSGLRGDARHIAAWVQSEFLAPEVQKNAEAIGIFVSDRHLGTAGSNVRELLTGNYGSMKGLDDRDFLRNEIANREINGTCCAIGDQKILTAGHVLGEQERLWLAEDKLYVLFGFATRIDGQTQTARHDRRTSAGARRALAAWLSATRVRSSQDA